MVQQELKLFSVEGKYSNSALSRMINFGDDYAERYSLTEIVVTASAEEAIEQVWSVMWEKCEQHLRVVRKVINEIDALENEGKHEEAKLRKEAEMFPFFGKLNQYRPPVPEDREKWQATQVEVEGYRIIVETSQ